MRTVIVGNGILALTAALRLARRGGEVVIVGPADRPGSATLAAPAMLNAFAELYGDAIPTEVDRAKFELARGATAAWEAFAAELGGDLGLGFGTYVFGDAAPIVAACTRYGEPHEIVSAREVPGYAGEATAVRLPREGWIDPRRVVSAIERALAAAPNVTLVDGVVERLRAAGGAIVAAHLADGRELGGTHFLAANGASLTPLLEASDLGLAVQRVVYGVGTTIELRVGRTACLRAASTYLVPCGADRTVIGATNEVSLAPRPAAADTPARLLRAAASAFDPALAGAEITRANVGWRPITLDTYPLLGRTSIANLVIASGTRRDGFHLAPLLADQLAALVHGAPTDPRLQPFAPERAVLRTLTRAQAVERAVRAGGDREEIERIHDAAGAHAWGIPPELLSIYRASDHPEARRPA